MLRIPYSRRKRERLFHKLWVYLVVTSGVLILIFLSLSHNIQHNEDMVPTTTEKDFPVFDDPFIKEAPARIPVYPSLTNSRAGGFLPEDEKRVGQLLKEEQDPHDGEDGRRLTEGMERLQLHQIPLTATVKIDPALIGSGQYHYTNVIVHFDLKGAPPKIQYFLDLLNLVAKSGATGILMEWEDMFPWSGELKMVRNTNAYTVQEVQNILQKARELRLEVIPLVQTFGHMEWILKYEEFRKYRDDDRYPQVVCLGNQGAMNLVKQAIKQVVDIHLPYGIKYFHIGADEAFRYGSCNASLRSLGSEEMSEDLALKHIKTIASYAKSITKKARILAWHDMFKTFSDTKVKEYEMGDVVELVIWDYSESLITMPHSSFLYMGELFPKLWASSAFKGADFPGATFSNIQHYETNNLDWLREMRYLRAEPKGPSFEGIIITGWSRYDHMASLCELMPTGTPSMVLNTQIALIGADKKYDLVNVEHVSVAAKTMAYKILGCGDPTSYKNELDVLGCEFPGSKVNELIDSSLRSLLRNQDQFFRENHKVFGWLSPYNIAYNISQSWHLYEVLEGLRAESLHDVTKQIEFEMQLLFHNETVDEFLFTKVDPVLDKIIYYRKAVQRLQGYRTYERRSFKIHRKNFSEILRSLV